MKFALQTSLLNAHPHCIADARRKLISEIDISSSTFCRGGERILTDGANPFA